jgi:succinate dehydrogenase / fumarate reductase, membrane anchor subunit
MSNGTDLGKVRGLGSAKHGASHWLEQRVTAIANFALMLWFIASMLMLPNYEYKTITMWIAAPLVAVPLALLVLSVISHMKIGLQVFIEDYVHDEGLKFASLFALTAYCWGAAAFVLFAIAKIAFTGAAG